MSSDPINRCGVGIFSTSEDDPFNDLCQWHDMMYVLKEKGQMPWTRDEVDNRFYNAMMIKAGDDLALQFRARVYYLLARELGGLVW